jgi:hypothetical protein
MTNTPALSIITPVLNGEAFIGAAIRSVHQAAALGADVEHIIVDGGSTDRTLEIVEDARATGGSPITHVLSGPDSGQSEAINRGLGVAGGRYVGWLNADDFYVPAGLAALSEFATGSIEDVILGRCRFVDPAGRTVYAPTPPDPVTADALLRLLSGWFAGRSIVQPEAFVKRESLLAAGGVEESLHYTMDYHLWLRLAIDGAAFRMTGIDLARQLAHPGQKTVDNAAVVAEMLTYAFGMLDRVPSSPGCEKATEELNRLRDRLRRFNSITACHDRILSAASSRFVSAPGDNGLSDSQIQFVRSCVSSRSSLLIAGMDPQVTSQLISGLRVKVPPVMTDKIPLVSGAFDVVLTSGAAAAALPDSFALTDLLKPGGSVFLTGAISGDLLRKQILSERKALADSLTYNGHVSLDTQAAERNREQLHRQWAHARAVRVPGTVRVESVDDDAQRRLSLTASGATRPGAPGTGYRTGFLYRLY